MYIDGNDERQLQVARADSVDGLEGASALEKTKKEKRLQNLEGKALNLQYLRQNKEVRSEKSWV